MIDTSDTQEFDPAECVSPEDNRPVNDDELGELLESLRQDGQIVSGIVSVHPTLPGKKLVVAGNRRKRCCELLDIPFRAAFIDRVLTRVEIIRIRVGENVHRKNPSPFQLCQDVSEYMEERKLATWMEVSRELSLSPATICRITSVKRIPAELRPKAESVCPSVCWLIASLRSNDAMHRALAYAATVGPDGKLPTRDQVARFVQQLKGKKPPPPPKLKPIVMVIDGRRFEVDRLVDDSVETLVEAFKSAAAELRKHKDLRVDTVAVEFAARDESAA